MENESTPYKAPISDLGNSDESLEIISVSKWLRFFNLIIDYIGFSILGAIIGVVVAILFGEQGIKYLESIPDFVLGVPIVLSYYIIFEGFTGRTLGKLVTGTKVVNELGKKPSFSQIVGRSCSRIIPFEAFSFLGEDGRGWHDSLPKTYVTKCR